MAATCGRPGCGKATWNGLPGFCSIECSDTGAAVAPSPGAPDDPPWIVHVSPGERDAGVLARTTASRAARAFEEHGLVLLRGVVPPSVAEQCCDTVTASLEFCRSRLLEKGMVMETSPFGYHEIVHRSRLRFDMRLLPGSPHTAQAAIDPSLEDLAPWVQVVQLILGEAAWKIFTGGLMSLPGAEPQDTHMDGHHLFDDAIQCPPHCLTVLVPLVPVTRETGPTEFWPGSHNLERRQVGASPGAAPELSLGDALLFDYKLIHRGTENVSDHLRPVMYTVWGRSWFNELVNFPSESLFA